MQNKKNQTSVGQMIQRCHKWRQKRKQYMDLARQTTDEIERERLLQTAEHYGRIVNEEQIKIDSQRDPKDKAVTEIVESAENAEPTDTNDEEEIEYTLNTNDIAEQATVEIVTKIKSALLSLFSSFVSILINLNYFFHVCVKVI